MRESYSKVSGSSVIVHNVMGPLYRVVIWISGFSTFGTLGSGFVPDKFGSLPIYFFFTVMGVAVTVYLLVYIFLLITDRLSLNSEEYQLAVKEMTVLGTSDIGKALAWNSNVAPQEQGSAVVSKLFSGPESSKD